MSVPIDRAYAFKLATALKENWESAVGQGWKAAKADPSTAATLSRAQVETFAAQAEHPLHEVAGALLAEGGQYFDYLDTASFDNASGTSTGADGVITVADVDNTAPDLRRVTEGLQRDLSPEEIRDRLSKRFPELDLSGPVHYMDKHIPKQDFIDVLQAHPRSLMRLKHVPPAEELSIRSAVKSLFDQGLFAAWAPKTDAVDSLERGDLEDA
jgi:hypothetical protein